MNKLQIETSTILLQKKELRQKAKELLKTYSIEKLDEKSKKIPPEFIDKRTGVCYTNIGVLAELRSLPIKCTKKAKRKDTNAHEKKTSRIDSGRHPYCLPLLLYLHRKKAGENRTRGNRTPPDAEPDQLGSLLSPV